ncbi:transaldolase B [Alcanivorax sp. S71-1-4]|uniref:transaldolase n=1 Tax=Alcanivorax sp. S71-1-4 TaxID=1177159 RepID=UPI00135A8685|nr:transaldolase [Alcanivorax sp. S71-1-4]KAF0809141.1 transaldolase B [Alcanivorax sp. S71-1-4]
MTSKRAQLAAWSTLVADTGELAAIRALTPVDATTNPSLLLSVAKQDAQSALLADARHLARQIGPAEDLALRCDAFATLTGQTILELIPGLVSTEVDARLSFDTRATVERARGLMALYRELGVDTDRVLIKIAATWEGIRAAEILEQEGIRCNLTLVFCLEQALAAAQRCATLISPFVGRIYDWYVKRGMQVDTAEQDPGVISVRTIFHTLKGLGLDTIVMGASFRNQSQIEALAGCDRLTISPALLEGLEQDSGPLTRHLDPADITLLPEQLPMDETTFRWALNDNPMACELLADGIRRFARDQEALEALLQATD